MINSLNGRKKYIICTMQSSGSKMLCSALGSTNLTGLPEEHFYWWIQGKYDLKAAIDNGMQNEIYGVKIMANYLHRIEDKLIKEGIYKGEKNSIADIFSDGTWIYLIRKDTLGIALSRFTKRLAKDLDINIFDFEKKNQLLTFDYYAIRNIINFEINFERHYWSLWFGHQEVKPVIVFYEDICQDMGVLSRLLSNHGIEIGHIPNPATKIESTHINRLFRDLFLIVDNAVSDINKIQVSKKTIDNLVDYNLYDGVIDKVDIQRNLEVAYSNITDYPKRWNDTTPRWKFFDSEFFNAYLQLLKSASM